MHVAVAINGSTKVFRQTARHFLDVARNGPGYVGDAREIHIEYCDEWDS
ncbi:hypothetical protein ACWD5Q_13680 [Streptomyces sp. NPDC002513]